MFMAPRDSNPLGRNGREHIVADGNSKSSDVPQASLPFSQEELTYISALDANAEVELLKAALPMLHPGALRMLVMATTLLQKAAVAGFTLGEIGGMMTGELRGMDEEASQFETMCTEAKLSLTRLLAEEAEAECHKPIAAQGSFEKDKKHGIEKEPLHFEMDGEDVVGQNCGTDAEVTEGFPLGVNVRKVYSGFARPVFDRIVMMSPCSQSTSSRTDISSSSSPFGLYFSPCSAPSVSPPTLPLEECEGRGGAHMPRLDGVGINQTMGGSREWHVGAGATGVDPNSCPTLSHSAFGVGEVQGATEVYGASSELQNAFPADGCMIFSELSEKHWTMYMGILRDVMSSVLDDCKQQSGMSSKRFGTSCRF